MIRLVRFASAGAVLLAQPAAASIDYVFVDAFETAPDCSAELTCPTPPPGKTCISGRLSEGGSGLPLRAYFEAGRTCAGGAVGGPCDLALSAHDALQFAQNPFSSQPLQSVERTVDGCGRYRFAGLDAPTLGFVAIVADDASSQPEDLFVTSATPRALAAGNRIDGFGVYAARRDTVDRWTQSAGAPFGAGTFADVGALLLQFTHVGGPQTGVSVTLNGNVFAGQDWYFADTAPGERFVIDPMRTNTGASGAALFSMGAQGTYSGTGAEPPGCTWSNAPAASVGGVVFFVGIESNCP